jgi:hypothetical protein
MRTLPLLSALALLAACGDDAPTWPDAGTTPVDGGICTSSGDCEEIYPVSSRAHVPEPVDYPDRPPAGGPHSACWTWWGVHSDPVPDERFVHNQEHGGVIFVYHCPDGCPAEQAALEGLVDGRPYAVVVPYDEMTAKYAVLAWGYRLVTDTFDLDAFEAFYDEHVDRGPEKFPPPPPGPPGGCPQPD